MATNNVVTQKMFSIKDVYFVIMLVIGLAGVYFPMKAKIGELERVQTELKSEIKENNLSTINYRLDDLQKDFTDFKSDFDEFSSAFLEWARSQK